MIFVWHFRCLCVLRCLLFCRPVEAVRSYSCPRPFSSQPILEPSMPALCRKDAQRFLSYARLNHNTLIRPPKCLISRP